VAKLKFGYTGQVGPPLSRSVRSMARIESQGWDFVRYPDQMGSTHPSVMTTDLGLHSAVIDPLRRSPSVFAQEAMTVTHLSKGRATWCIGAGENKQFEPFGERRTNQTERMVEAIQVMQTLWDNPYRAVSRDSEYWPLRDAVFPLPLYEGHKPSTLAVGGVEAVLRVGGEVCDGWMTFLPGGVSDDVETLATSIKKVKGYAEAAGRDPDSLRFSAMVMVMIAENDDMALGFTKHPTSAWAGIWCCGPTSGKMWKSLGFEHPYGEDASWPKNMSVAALDPEEVKRLPELVPESIMEHTMVWGSPERVIRRLEPFIDAGLTELSFLNCVPWSDPAYGPHFAELASQVIVGLGGNPLRLDA
jgi:phthiodiolone/phenolphthiodiolone dimycocerosates ketoreductase